jgi:hypothetical protein
VVTRIDDELERLRRSVIPDELPDLRAARARGAWHHAVYAETSDPTTLLGRKLAVLGWRRWRAILNTDLVQQPEHAVGHEPIRDAELSLSLLASIAVAVDAISATDLRLLQLVRESARQVGFARVDDARWSRARETLRLGAAIELPEELRVHGEVDLAMLSSQSWSAGLAFFLLATPVLELLVDRLAMTTDEDSP